MIIDNLDEFVIIEKRIDAAEDQAADVARESLRDRWEFGRLMVAKRVGKQLPKGVLAALVEATGKSQAELNHRAQFAERYPTEDEVCNALQTCTSWRQVIASLPKPAPARPATRKQTPAPKADSPELVDAILDNEAAGGNYTARDVVDRLAAKGVEVSEDTVERKRNTIRAAANAAPVEWDSIPGNQRDKLERARTSIRRELEREYRTRLLAELDQHRAELDAKWDAYKAAYDKQNAALNAMRDDERRRYQQGIEVHRGKGLILIDDYNLIRSCLHPDSRNSVTDEKLAAAFRVFNDSKIKVLLVKET